MAIIKYSKGAKPDWAKFNLYPDQFVSAKEKTKDDWIQSNMDYFASVGYSQYLNAKNTFVNNYNLVKGILRPEDFYIEEDNEIRSFTDTLLKDVELPNYVKHYPILNPPLNTMVGEQAKRPDFTRVKAFDEESKNEELQFKTQIMQDFIMQTAKAKIEAQVAQEGGQATDEQIQQMTMDSVLEYMTDYTSTAEKWANHVLEALKMELNLKEISEDCFRDLLICSREFYHIYEDNSKLGLAVENLNPKNVWYLSIPDKKYTKESYAAGTVHVMELSEIIERFSLDKEEIDYLRKGISEFTPTGVRESNFNTNKTGQNTIIYDTYSPLVEQERILAESLISDNKDPIGDYLGISSPSNSFGSKYIVVQAYWVSKEKIGRLVYFDENGEPQTKLVDETYKKIPNEISIEWDYVNRWYRGLKVGPHVYKVEPFKLLDYCPIIGVVHEIKNVSEAKSMIDLLKPYQVLYNVCMNQLYKLLEKEVGNVMLTSIRHIPTPKDGDPQDALDIWQEKARSLGVLVLDDSPENMKSPSNFNAHKTVDWSRTNEIQSRYTLAQQLKIEAWELIGITRERTGGIAATQTATGTNAALSQSYAQTEPWFTQHEYVLNEVYQALLDAAQYIEVQKPYSTLSYINTEGEEKFMKINSLDIKMKDLKVFVTSRASDQRTFEELKQLAQPMLQNGATPYEIAVLYSTNSVRQMKQVFKSLKDKMDQMAQREQELQQMQLEQQQAQFEQAQQQIAAQDEINKAHEADQNELDRLNKKEVALINAAAKERSAFDPVSGAGDDMMIRAGETALAAQQMERDYELKLRQMQQKQKESNDYVALELKKLAMQREKMQSDMALKKMDQKIKAQQKKAQSKSKK